MMKQPICVLICLLLMVVGSVRGQWVRREIPLNPGWNAVFLDVAAEPADCDALFAAYPAIESVWRWNRRFSSGDF